MTKLQFILALNNKLSGLPQDDVEQRLNFYAEMIEDRMEEGITEEEAVSAIGSVDEIAAQIIADIPLAKIAKEKMKPKRRLKAWEVVLLAVGSPVWFSFLIAAFAVIFSLYVVLWSVIISFSAVFVSFIVCIIGVAAVGIGYALSGNLPAGFAMIGASVICAGMAIFAFYGCKVATKGTLLLTKKIGLWIKSWFIRKEEAV